jgi:hypothetical protein
MKPTRTPAHDNVKSLLPTFAISEEEVVLIRSGFGGQSWRDIKTRAASELTARAISC